MVLFRVPKLIDCNETGVTFEIEKFNLLLLGKKLNNNMIVKLIQKKNKRDFLADPKVNCHNSTYSLKKNQYSDNSQFNVFTEKESI